MAIKERKRTALKTPRVAKAVSVSAAMPAKTSPARSSAIQVKQSRGNRSSQPGSAASPTIVPVAALRAELQMTQAEFARLLPISVRSLASLEGGKPPEEAMARRLTELRRLTAALAEVIRREALGSWLRTPNPAFDGLKPMEVIERGESDRLWNMIYLLRSGVPF